MNKFILNADDFGLSKEFNDAVLKGYTNGFLRSVSLCANGDYFTNAINEIIPRCSNISVGVHLNIAEGKSLTKCSLLTDKYGNFKNRYLSVILKSHNKHFLKQIELEFRAQIEKIRKYVQISHLDSHNHIHAIPSIFELTCRLAKEYNISYVRTQYESLYFVPKIKKYITFKYPINLIKIALLNLFTISNKNIIKKYEILTNDFILGVGYTGMMDSDTIEYGLKNLIKKKDCIVETLIHPCLYNKIIKNSHYYELLAMLDKNLEQKINVMNFKITNLNK